MSIISVSRLIVKKIEEWGVKHVPIFQGGAISQVLSEIGLSKKIKYYCPYHEQALAMAVDAYARISGFGVGLVTSGPGATNLITGVACSYYDSIPCIFFTGQVGQFHITGKRKVRQRGFQETDVVSIFKPITKFAYQLKNPREVSFILDKAYYLATSGRPGPVVIDVPFNIQKAEINTNLLKKFFSPAIKDLNIKGVQEVLNLVTNSRKPLLIAGGGLRISKQINNFLKFVKSNKIPFITTWPAQDIVNSDYINYFGSLGRHAHLSASNIAAEADLIITFGVRFSPKIVTKFFAKNAKIVAVDIDKFELTQGLVKADISINCDLKNFFNNSKIKKYKRNINNSNNWLNFCYFQKKKNFINNATLTKNKEKFVNPYLFLKEFSNFVKKDSVLLTDAGCNLTYFMQAFISKKGQRIISAWGNSPMGYSVAAGIGAKLAYKKSVISLIGDGSFLINLQELQFIKFNKIPLKIVVFDNKVFGNTKIGCEVYKIKNVGNDKNGGYFPPEVKKISKAFDIKYIYLNSNRNQSKLIKKFLNYKKSCILHLNISSDQPLIEHSNI